MSRVEGDISVVEDVWSSALGNRRTSIKGTYTGRIANLSISS